MRLHEDDSPRRRRLGGRCNRKGVAHFAVSDVVVMHLVAFPSIDADSNGSEGEVAECGSGGLIAASGFGLRRHGEILERSLPPRQFCPWLS